MNATVKFLLTLLVIMAPVAANAQDDELLEPEKAFAYSVGVNEAGEIEAVWSIADGYYMYRDKFGFRTAADGVSLGEPVYPPGKIKTDEFFGDVEIYTGEILIRVPVTAPDAVTSLELEALGQGCNEPIGVCYPPMVRAQTVALTTTDGGQMGLAAKSSTDTVPDSVSELRALLGGSAQPATPAASATPAEDNVNSVNDLKNLLGGLGGEPEFLDVDDAFQLSVESAGSSALTARFRVADGYYLYRDKITFASAGGDAALTGVTLPEGKPKFDEFFGDMVVYPEDFEVPLSMQRLSGDAGSFTIKAQYQGCADQGICYPPVEKTLAVSLPALLGFAPAAAAEPSTPTTSGPEAEAASIEASSLLGYLAAAFGAGLLLTFTPCVLPLIPILSSVIVGQGDRLTRSRGGALSLIYVLGTAVTYAAIGAVAGATGDQLQAYFQNVWAIGTVSVIFVLMALSMFGLYEIQVPSFIQSRLASRSQSIGGGSVSAVFVLGALSALIVGACVSPLLISVLSIAILKGDPVLGAALMVAMALGMGVILIAIGFGAGFLLPKAGAWMDRVKYVFGVLLLGVAIYLLGNIPEVPVLLLWAALLIVVGVYLGATQAIPEGVSGWRYLFKGLGTIMLIWGVLAMLGGFNGNRDIMRPVDFSVAGARTMLDGGTEANASTGAVQGGVAQGAFHFTRVANLQELDQQIAAANRDGKSVLLDYYADWCTDCIRMERTTFQHTDVRRVLESRFVTLQADVTDPTNPDSKALKQRYGVFGPPAILFFNPDGGERKELRLYGYRDAEEFLRILEGV